MSTLESWSPKILSLLRAVSGLLFLQHGMQKVLSFPPKPPPPVAPSLAMTLGAASGPIELVGGMLLLIGLFTRSAAFIASGPQAPTSPRSPAAAARMRCSGIIHSFKCSVHCHKCLGERLLRRAPRGGGGGLERPGQHVCRELCRFSTPMAIKYGK